MSNITDWIKYELPYFIWSIDIALPEHEFKKLLETGGVKPT
jgi:hypothetical protein